MRMDFFCVFIGEVVAGGGKQKNMAVEGRNRRALGDIGNLVAVRGIDAKQISRPVTRFPPLALSLSLSLSLSLLCTYNFSHTLLFMSCINWFSCLS